MPKKSRRPRPNSNFEHAAEGSRAFHGREPEAAIVLEETVRDPSHLAILGELDEIEIDRPHRFLMNFDGTQLCWDPSCQQMYLRGGDQKVDLAEFGHVDRSKRFLDLGLVRSLTYTTDKQHLNAEDRQPGPYKHELGEEGGRLPLAVYDQLNHSITFVGGTYHIDRDIDGQYSAGIRD